MSTEKVSLSLEKDLVAEARNVVGKRGLSGYVNQALRHQLQRERIAQMLADFDREVGPVDAAILEEVRREWPDRKRSERKIA